MERNLLDDSLSKNQTWFGNSGEMNLNRRI